MSQRQQDQDGRDDWPAFEEMEAGRDGRPPMDWLDEDPAPAGPPQAEAEYPAPQNDEGHDRNLRGRKIRRAAIVAVPLLLLAAGLGLVLLSKAGPPPSPALEAERGAPDLDVGEAPPLPRLPLPEMPVPDAQAKGEPDLNVPPPAEPASPPANPDKPAEDAQDAVGRRLDTLLALVERLERSENVLRSRVDGLELAVQQEQAPRPAEAGGASLKEEQPKPQPFQKSAKAPRKPPPRKAALAARQPPGSQQTDGAAPFAVESVDTWDGEKIVVVRDGPGLRELKVGDGYKGWRVESVDGRAATLSGPGGKRAVATGAGGGQE